VSEFLSPTVRVRALVDQASAAGVLDNDATIGLVGLAERGPIGIPTRISSADEFRKIFGGYVSGMELAFMMDLFWLNANGRGEVFIVRTAHYTDVTDATTLTAAKATDESPDVGPGYAVSGATPDISLAAGATSFQIALSGEVPQMVVLTVPIAGGAAIAAAIQVAVRAMTAAFGPNQPDYNGFRCVFDTDERYVLINGTVGATKTVEIFNAAALNAADELKLGSQNGGTSSPLAGFSLSGTAPATVTGALSKTLRVALSGEVAQSITVSDALVTGAAIAAAIQVEVQALTAATLTNQADYDNFRAYFVDGRYLLINGTPGAGKNVVVTDGLTNNMADDLKLGVLNTGTEFVGAAEINALAFEATSEGNWGNSISRDITHQNKVRTTLALDLVDGDEQITVSSTSGIVAGTVLGITDMTAPLNAPATIYVVVDRVANGIVFLTEAVTLTETIEAGDTPATVRSQEFQIIVREDGRIRETFNYLSMNPANVVDFVETKINGISDLIVVDALANRSLNPYNRPAETLNDFLIGGDDGLVNLDDTDFVGDATAKTGMRAYENLTTLNILAVPDRATPIVHQAMQDFAVSKVRFMFYPDCPAGLDREGIITYVQDDAGLSSEFGGMWWPRMTAGDPRNRNLELVVPTSGPMLGLLSRLASSSYGVHTPPGGEQFPLQGVTGLEATGLQANEESSRDILFPARINPICQFDDNPNIVSFGPLTLVPGGTGGFPEWQKSASFLKVGRETKLIVRKLLISSPADEALHALITGALQAYLTTKRIEGMLSGQTDEAAYVINFPINIPELRRGIVKMKIGCAFVEAFKFAGIDIFEMRPSTTAAAA
jgi:hypothetical protein